jgi:ABC-type transporter Mla subunit MlaD
MGLLLPQSELHLHVLTAERTPLEGQLDRLLAALDDLHSAVSDGTLSAVTTLSRQELVGWLNDLIYTASETLDELADHGGQPGGFPPPLTVLRRSDKRQRPE